MNASPPLLLAARDPAVVGGLLRALTKAGVRNPVDVVDDPESALDYLLGRPELGVGSRPLPALLLVDEACADLASRVRGAASLRGLPVLVAGRPKSSSGARDGPPHLAPPFTPPRLRTALEGLKAPRLRLE